MTKSLTGFKILTSFPCHCTDFGTINARGPFLFYKWETKLYLPHEVVTNSKGNTCVCGRRGLQQISVKCSENVLCVGIVHIVSKPHKSVVIFLADFPTQRIGLELINSLISHLFIQLSNPYLPSCKKSNGDTNFNRKQIPGL